MLRYIDPTKNALEKHIDYCEHQLIHYCSVEKSTIKPHYFEKQIEVARRKLKRK